MLPLDVIEDDTGVTVRAAIPGVKAEDIEVSIVKHVLTIKGQTNEEDETEKTDYLMKECRTGNFHRSLRLPNSVDVDKAESRCTNGVLTIAFPRIEPQKTKYLEISAT